MRIVITLEDTREGLCSEAELYPNGISEHASQSVAAMVAIAFSNHLVHLKQLGLLVVCGRDTAVERGLIEALPLQLGHANPADRR